MFDRPSSFAEGCCEHLERIIPASWLLSGPEAGTKYRFADPGAADRDAAGA